MIVTIQNLLSPEQLAKVKSALARAKFLDGNITATTSLGIKNNLELEVGEEYVAIVENIEKALRSNNEIQHKLLPRSMTRPIISRYKSGMFYKEHVDMPIQGMATQYGRSMAPYGTGFVRTDFSMTLFLDEPLSYEGGELEVRVKDEKQLFKLDAGSAVFYPTGSVHSVRPVLSGFRTAAVLWMQSMIKNSDTRQLLWEAYTLHRHVHDITPDSEASSLAYNHYCNLLRSLAEL